jgi:hypothetical protein
MLLTSLPFCKKNFKEKSTFVYLQDLHENFYENKFFRANPDTTPSPTQRMLDGVLFTYFCSMVSSGVDFLRNTAQ